MISAELNEKPSLRSGENPTVNFAGCRYVVSKTSAEIFADRARTSKSSLFVVFRPDKKPYAEKSLLETIKTRVGLDHLRTLGTLDACNVFQITFDAEDAKELFKSLGE